MQSAVQSSMCMSKLPNNTHVLSLSIKEQLWFAVVLCLSANESNLSLYIKVQEKHAAKLSNAA